MANELMTNEDAAYNSEMAALLGVDGANFKGGWNGIPVLSINYHHEDDDGCRLPAGQFRVTVPSDDGTPAVTVYASEVSFQPYMNRFQFVHYDGTANEGKGAYINKSIYVPDFSTEALDELGGTRCGKRTTKQYKELGDKLTSAQEKIKKDVTLNRVVFGVVSLAGTTAPRKDEKGKEVAGEAYQVNSLPVLIKLKGANFSEMGEIFKKLDSLKRYPFTALLNMTTKREKNGALTYYVIQYAYDLAVSLKLGKDGIALVNKFNETISAENVEVLKKHKKAKTAENTEEAEDINDALSDDFNDPIPF